MADERLEVDDLAQFIRKVDGSHSLGAGALAENIMRWVDARYVSRKDLRVVIVQSGDGRPEAVCDSGRTAEAWISQRRAHYNREYVSGLYPNRVSVLTAEDVIEMEKNRLW